MTTCKKKHSTRYSSLYSTAWSFHFYLGDVKAIYTKVPEDIYFKLLVYTFKPRNTGSLLHLVTKLGQQMSSKLDQKISLFWHQNCLLSSALVQVFI